MKKIILALALLFVMNFAAEAQHRGRGGVRPTIVVGIQRPMCPSPNHIWVDDEYIWDSRRGDYIVQQGYWAIPPHHGHYWVSGHWAKRHHHGRQWIPGHWSRR